MVPLSPNELTPPLMSSIVACARSIWAGSDGRRCPMAAVTCGFIARSCAFGQTTAWHLAVANCSNPASPAVGSVCPTFALHAITLICCGSSRTAHMARASIGSPRLVPVPCASSTKAPRVERPALSRAARIKACCAVPFGAVRLALLPSCRTEQASARTPRTSSEAEAGSSATQQQASPRAYPFARTSNACDFPEGDVICAAAKSCETSLSHITFTPSTSPRSEPRQRCAYSAP